MTTGPSRWQLPNEREELIKDLRTFADELRKEDREIEADIMVEAAGALASSETGKQEPRERLARITIRNPDLIRRLVFEVCGRREVLEAGASMDLALAGKDRHDPVHVAAIDLLDFMGKVVGTDDNAQVEIKATDIGAEGIQQRLNALQNALNSFGERPESK